MKTIPLTQGKVALVDDEYYDKLNQYKWHAHKERSGYFYAERSMRKDNGKQTTIHMARVVLELSGDRGSGLVVHHKSHDTLDNRFSNLEFVKREDNVRDTIKNTSGFAGVSWRKDTKKFRASITIGDKYYHIGHFNNPLTAALARIEWMAAHGIDTTFSVQQLQTSLETVSMK